MGQKPLRLFCIATLSFLLYACGASPDTSGPTATPVPTQGSTNPPTSGGVRAISDETVPAGTIVVERLTNFNNQTVQIWYGSLPSNATFNSSGQVRLEGWKGYGSVQAAQQGAATEYASRKKDSPDNYSSGYTVTYSDHAFTSDTTG